MATVENVEFKWMDKLPNDRRMYVEWVWKIANTQSFDVKIEYQITLGDGSTIWMDGYSQSVSVDDQSSHVGDEANGKFKTIWTVPDDVNLGLTRLMIHPISKTYTSNGSTVNYFYADYWICAFVMAKIKPNRPTTNEITMAQDEKSRSSLVVSAVGVKETGGSNSNVTDVEFQLLRFTTDCGGNIYEIGKTGDDNTNLKAITDNGKIINTVKAALSEFDNARVYFPLDAGYFYTVRARYLSSGVAGQWSNIVTPMIASQPMRPRITKVLYDSASGTTAYAAGQEIYWEFNKVNGDESSYNPGYLFQVQFCISPSYFASFDAWYAANPNAADTAVADMLDLYNIINVGTTTNMYMRCSDPSGSYSKLHVGNDRVYFRVRTISESSSITLYSDWSDLFEFVPKTKALPPTVWLDKPYVYIDDPEDTLHTVNIYYMHNSQCGTKATQGRLYWVADDQSSQSTTSPFGFLDKDTDLKDATSENYTPVFTHKYNYGHIHEECHINIIGKTLDQYDQEGSPWSSPVRLYFYKMPELSARITSVLPNNDGTYTVTSFPIEYEASIELGSLTEVIGYSVVVTANESYTSTNASGKLVTISAGSEIYNKYYTKLDAVNLIEQILPQEIVLMNGMSYTLTIAAGISSGATASSSMIFIPNMTNSAHELNARYIFDNDTMSLGINAFAGQLPRIKPEGEAVDTNPTIDDDVLINIYRIQDDGSMITIAENIENTDSLYVIDPHPSLNEASYRIVAVDKVDGKYTYNDVPPYPVKCSDIILQWNESYDKFNNADSRTNTKQVNNTMLRLKYNIDVSESADLDTNLVKYVGRKDPVAYYGTQTGYTATWSTAIPKTDMDTIRLLRKLQVYPGDVYVREPSGTGYWARVKVTFPINHCQPAVNVSLDITRVEGGI